MRGAGIERAEIAGATRAVLARGRGLEPDVLLVETPAGPAVVKDYAPRAGWVRFGPGRWLARREQQLYGALEGVRAVPGLLGPIDALAFAIEYRAGEPLSRGLAARRGTEAVARFLEALETSIERMHERGVVHLDLRHRDNVLMDEAAQPVVIDFGTGVWLRPGTVGYRWLRPWLQAVDRRALAKWQDRLRPGAGPSPRSAWRRWRSRRRRRRARATSAQPR